MRTELSGPFGMPVWTVSALCSPSGRQYEIGPACPRKIGYSGRNIGAGQTVLRFLKHAQSLADAHCIEVAILTK